MEDHQFWPLSWGEQTHYDILTGPLEQELAQPPLDEVQDWKKWSTVVMAEGAAATAASGAVVAYAATQSAPEHSEAVADTGLGLGVAAVFAAVVAVAMRLKARRLYRQIAKPTEA